MSMVVRGDEFGEFGGERAEHAPLAGGPADGERLQGRDGDGADRAAGWSDKSGQGGRTAWPISSSASRTAVSQSATPMGVGGLIPRRTKSSSRRCREAEFSG